MDPSEARSDLFLRQRNALNLQVLQTYNPKIHSIIDSSSYVVLYEFDAAKGEWVGQPGRGLSRARLTAHT